MLGFAFSEAYRSQELMMKLHNQKSSGNVVAGGGESTGNDASQGGGQRRTRRRRRSKKPTNGAGIPMRAGPRPDSFHHNHNNNSIKTASRPNSRTASSVRASTTTKRHDEPMRKRDLHFALRCGMVSTGKLGEKLAAGRVTLVNWDGNVVLDTFVKVPPEEVFDYRTEETGITADLLAMTSALQFNVARAKVGNIIRGKILVGHGLELDLAALSLSHPACDIRDTTTYDPYMKKVTDGQIAMKLPREMDELIKFVFGRESYSEKLTIVREAAACMELYKHVRTAWERELMRDRRQKEHQRQMIMNMRFNSGAHLSAIKENDALVAGAGRTRRMVNSKVAYPELFDYEDSTFTTMASTAERWDDTSDTSTFYTQETDTGRNHSFFRIDSDAAPSHLDNISDISSVHDLEEPDEPRNSTASGLWSQQSRFSGMAWENNNPPENPELLDAGLPISEDELRAQLPSNLLADIEETSERLDGLSHQDDYSDIDDTLQSEERNENSEVSGIPNFQVEAEVEDDASDEETEELHQYDVHSNQTEKIACREKEASRKLGRLPPRGDANDLELRRSKCDEYTTLQDLRSAESSLVVEEKKKGWFGMNRRQRSTSGASLSNSDRSRQDDSVQSEALSGSDRTHPVRNLLSNEQWLDAEVGPPKFARFRRNSLSQSPATKPRTTRPPPGFGS